MTMFRRGAETNADNREVENIGKYEIRLSLGEKAKLEDGIAKRAPVTSKPPPPKPPIALSIDKPVGKGEEKGKDKTGGSPDPKGSEREGKDSEWKDDSE